MHRARRSRRCWAIPCVVLAVLTAQLANGGQEQDEGSPPSGLVVKVMSFNIFWLPEDQRDLFGQDSWDSRVELVIRVIRDHDPDVVGLQEAAPWQLRELLEGLPGLAAFHRDPASVVPNLQALFILYKKDRFRVDEAASATRVSNAELPMGDWGAGSIRVPNWARLVERESGRAFYLFNVHHDHRFSESREWSTKRLVRSIGDRTHREPVVVTGDFNAGEDSASLRHLTGDGELVDSFRALHPNAERVGTSHAFTGNRMLGRGKIDFVLVTPATRVLAAEIVRTSVNGRFPSDHFPVTAKLLLR